MGNLKSNAPVYRDVNLVVTESLDRVHEDVFWVVGRAVDNAVSDDVYEAVYVNPGVGGVVDRAVWGAVDRAMYEDSGHPALQDFLIPCGAVGCPDV